MRRSLRTPVFEFLARVSKLALLSFIFFQPFSFAQANESATDIEEITVTARKREEREQQIKEKIKKREQERKEFKALSPEVKELAK